MKTIHLLGFAGATALALAAAAAAQDGPHGRHGPHAGGMGHHGGGHMRGAMALHMLHAADANGDRSVTRAEVDELKGEMFAWLDRNGDGVLDLADRSPIEQRMAAIHAADGDDGGADDGPGDGMMRRRGPHGEHWERLDANEDGAVSRDEFMNGGGDPFEELDANGDDVISPDEIDAKIAEHEGRRHWWRAE